VDVGSSGGGRDRGGRAVIGQAVPRPVYAGLPTNPIYIYNPWNSYYSRYGGYYGYGYNYGYSPCGWGYGCPYNPYWYDPFYRYGYYGYGYGFGHPGAYYPDDDPGQGYSSSSSGNRYSEPEESRRMGSLRIKATPATAKIYIDGTLVGTVDDFDGLTNHLEIEAGAHEMEVRADGYATLIKDINVKAGQTTTERLALKKK
jgi:hypothetical protein